LDGNFTIEKHDIQHMEQETGFLVQRQQLVFFGLCSACQEKAE
jgi:Fe2+ or Zn2+ uptake regulation protein